MHDRSPTPRRPAPAARVVLALILLAAAAGAFVLLLAPPIALGATGDGQPPTLQVPAPAQLPAPTGAPPVAPTGAPSAAQPGDPTGPTASPSVPARFGQGRWLWQRTEYGNGVVLAAPDPGRYGLALAANGRLELQADCNHGTGSYAVEGSRLTLTPGALTLAACPPGSHGAAFVRDLRDVATFVFDGDLLVLNLRADGGNMIFAAQPAPSLTGREWRVTGYNNGRGGVVSVLPDVPLTVTFGDDGSVSGNGGCNLYRGPYTIGGSAVSVGDLASTRRACLSDALNAQEQAFLAALRATAGYDLTGDRLSLRDATGALQVTLVRPSVQPSDPARTPGPGADAPSDAPSDVPSDPPSEASQG